MISLKLSQEIQQNYTNYNSFYAAVKNEPQQEVPKLFKDTVFLNVTDLLKALSKAGIILEFEDALIKKAAI